ncbi:MAG: transcription antitermination factor NusB [Pseudomonadota bacterium]|nr:transcription antitermination factor NusB [Pseudomonadota bacterium]
MTERKTFTGSAKARRTAARLAAVQLLYGLELAPKNVEDALRVAVREPLSTEIDGEKLITPDTDLLAVIARGVVARQTEIDALINEPLENRELKRLEAVIRAIMRAGAFELLDAHDTPMGVIVNDYVNIAHAFFAGREPALINAVLDKIGKTLRDEKASDE